MTRTRRQPGPVAFIPASALYDVQTRQSRPWWLAEADRDTTTTSATTSTAGP